MSTRPSADPTAEPSFCIDIGKGGVVKYMGSEKHGDSPVYSDAAHALETYWAKKHHLKTATAYVTAHTGHKGQLDWTHPDLVLRGRTQKKQSVGGWHLHAFEVEKVGGFSMASIFQAYVQASGADFAWVLYSRQDVPSEYFERVTWAAGQVGVGLISYGKPGSITTWREELQARFRKPSMSDHTTFVTSAFGEIAEF